MFFSVGGATTSYYCVFFSTGDEAACIFVNGCSGGVHVMYSFDVDSSHNNSTSITSFPAYDFCASARPPITFPFHIKIKGIFYFDGCEHV